MASAHYIDCRDVEFRRFTTDSLVLIAPADHPWAQRDQIEPEELYEGAYIMREDGAGTLATVRDGLARVGIDYDRLWKSSFPLSRFSWPRLPICEVAGR